MELVNWDQNLDSTEIFAAENPSKHYFGRSRSKNVYVLFLLLDDLVESLFFFKFFLSTKNLCPCDV